MIIFTKYFCYQGNDHDLVKYEQPYRLGKDCFGVNCNDEVEDDGYMCDRDCDKYPEPRLCYWKFVIEQYTSMGP